MKHTFVCTPSINKLFDKVFDIQFLIKESSSDYGRVTYSFDNKWNMDYWKLRHIGQYHAQYTVMFYVTRIRSNVRRFKRYLGLQPKGWVI